MSSRDPIMTVHKVFEILNEFTLTQQDTLGGVLNDMVHAHYLVEAERTNSIGMLRQLFILLEAGHDPGVLMEFLQQKLKETE